MSFGTSTTYIYAYIAFASVYLVASFTFVASALRVSTGLSRARQAMPAPDATTPSPAAVGTLIDHGQRIVDYTQLATLLPLVYIVGSLFLGSVITRDTDLAQMVNVGWVSFTIECAPSRASVSLHSASANQAPSDTLPRFLRISPGAHPRRFNASAPAWA